jgi:hypothetical protein
MLPVDEDPLLRAALVEQEQLYEDLCKQVAEAEPLKAEYRSIWELVQKMRIVLRMPLLIPDDYPCFRMAFDIGFGGGRRQKPLLVGRKQSDGPPDSTEAKT